MHFLEAAVCSHSIDRFNRIWSRWTASWLRPAGKSFHGKKKTAPQADEDDFDDIEDFEPININVNTLRNMMDSYQSQVGGAGPVSNLFSAMGVGMSAVEDKEQKDISESAV